MDILSQLYNAVIIDEEGLLVGRVDSIHLLGARMTIMIKTVEGYDIIEPDPDEDEVDPTKNIEDIEVSDAAGADADKIVQLKERARG